MIINENSRAVVVRDLPDLGLSAGDVGVVVHIHQNANKETVGYMLEIFSVDGESIDVVSVGVDEVRSAAPTDRMHARVAA
jgi:hypothetical protein